MGALSGRGFRKMHARAGVRPGAPRRPGVEARGRGGRATVSRARPGG